jgi:HlyD family secretion protein
MSKRVRYSIGLLLVLGAVGAGAYAWWNGRPTPADFRLAKVERGTIVAAVSATGTVNPVTAVQVGSQVSGQIQELLVDFNSEVKKGDIIARINPDAFQLKVSQAMADVEAANATVLTQRANVTALQAEVSRAKFGLADAERELKRNKGLFEKSFVSEAALDKAQATFDGAREQLNTAQAQLVAGQSQVRNVEALVRQREAQLAQARVDLDKTTIRAPVDGVVVKKSVEPGQTVAASLQAPELFIIARDLREMQVETSIDEAEVGRISVGQEVTFTVDSFPGRMFRGNVSQMRKAALVVQNVVTYTAIIATANPDLRLFPGMTANVRIVVDTRENVLRIPNSALRYRPAGAAPVSTAAADSGGAPAPEEDGKAARVEGKGRGGEAMRERLVKELNLTAEQQARLEAIMKETRAKMKGLDGEDREERRKQAGRLRADQRARIAEILNPEQRKRYEEMSASRAAGSRQVTSSRIWVPDAQNRPKAVAVRLGMTDGTYTEVVSGDLQEGSQVIVGTLDSGKSKSPLKGGPRFAF